MLLFVEQLLNGLQYGVMLSCSPPGLRSSSASWASSISRTARCSWWVPTPRRRSPGTPARSRSRPSRLPPPPAASGLAVEFLVIRRLYDRDHLDQVLATFGLLLFFNELVATLAGRTPLFMQPPAWPVVPSRSSPACPTRRFAWPSWRPASPSPPARVPHRADAPGMLIRASAHTRHRRRAGRRHPPAVHAGVALGALLAGLAGPDGGADPRRQVGMGEQILIATFVVVVIGGLGSVRGAFVGALLVGLVDTLARAFVPGLLKQVFAPTTADALGAGLASAAIYLLMALVLVFRPRGLLPA
jgi:branched-chain amino acid transport system permease protein